jgi:UDP-N-acetylglucosamine:LPS N-acetylglucosamine transferase
MQCAPRYLFIPVSGPFGMGEYARSLAIARGVESRWPAASIRFILSREAPYAAQPPYPTTLLDSSATFHSAAVIEVMRQWRPDVVIFDNAGRTAQLRAAKLCGARVVYISARRRQRRKAFRLRWMRLLDEHWIAYPEFIAGPLNFIERCKLKLMGRPRVRYLDVILERRREGNCGTAPSTKRVAPTGDFVLLVPGGGTGHPGAADAMGQFLGAARGLAAAGIGVLFVGYTAAATPVNPEDPESEIARLQVRGTLPQAELVELMRAARLIVANGGSTLLQALACGKPCIAVPIAGDQAERIRRCVNAGVAIAAPLDADSMRQKALELWQSEARLDALAGRTIALGLTDGLEVALRSLNALTERSL